ncbi:hypothetical protein [Spiroplasma endosymbiont of Notiophilus biguttatus]|uniref:hypothetical protein n=1 Tax=Spiroplasma endosymbiont of Notiophilus biguttatus TaxID=3066285 RepID=UPI00313F1F27
MENKNNIDWNVNLNYITKDDLKTIYGFIPDADQTTTDNTKTDFTIMAIAISSERINTITGNQIEVIGFKNLNETQQQLVKRATARMTIYYLTDGMAFIRSSVSISGNGLSSSISPPSEPDYVLMEVYNLLQQANLHTPRKAINNSISCNTDNFNTPSIFDESDTRLITWDSGNKTFLQKMGIIAGTGITIQDVSDTIPKLKLNVDANIDSLWETTTDNPNFIKPKDDKRIIDVGTPTFLTDATNKEYVDELLDKKQDKLTFNNQFKNQNNTISLDTEIVFNNLSIPNVNTTSKTVNGAINENKNNIDKKQDKINDLENKIFKDKEQKENFIELLTNAFYLANSLFDENEFYGTNTKELGNKIHLNTDGIVTILKNKNIPELETTDKTIISAINELNKRTKRLKIDSKTLLTNEIRENEWEINLKENPTPSPSIPKWKDVGTRENNKWDNWQITYDFQENKRYRVYFLEVYIIQFMLLKNLL